MNGMCVIRHFYYELWQESPKFFIQRPQKKKSNALIGPKVY